MRDFFKDRPFFCVSYVLFFGIAVALFAWQLSKVMVWIDLIAHSSAHSPIRFEDIPYARWPKHMLGTIRFLATEGNLEDSRLSGWNLGSQFGHMLLGLLSCLICLVVPVVARRRLAIVFLMMGITMILFLSLIVFGAAFPVHGGGAIGPRILLVLTLPTFAAYCVYVTWAEWRR